MTAVSTSDVDGHLVFIFLLTAVAFGVATRYFCSRFRLHFPYNSALLIVMTILGVVQLGASELSAAETLLAGIDPQLLQYIFLPILVLEAAMDVNIRNFRRLLPAILLLLIPGVICTALLTAVLIHYGLPAYDWDWVTSLTLGAVLVATDTMSVVHAMRKAGVSERLSALIEGESLLVDCISFILVSLFLDILLTTGSTSLKTPPADATSLDVGHEISTFVQEAACGPLFGYAIGLGTVWFLYRVINDAMIEITVSILASFVAFYVGTYHLEVNGNLAVVAFAFYFSQWERHTISPSVLPSLHDVLKSLSYASTTIIFAISGILASYYMFVASTISGIDVGYCIALYLFLHLTRSAAALLLLPVIRLFGFKLNYKDIAMISFSGIRGVQALVLMLTVVLNTNMTDDVRHRIGFQVSGIVLLTNLINAPTAGWVIRFLGLKSDNPEVRLVLKATIDQMRSEGETEIGQMKGNKQFEAVAWDGLHSLLDDVCASAMQTYSAGAIAVNKEEPSAPSTFTWGRVAAAVGSGKGGRLGLMSPSSAHHLSDSDALDDGTTVEMKEVASPTSTLSDTPISTDLDSASKQREDLVERFLELQRTEYHRLYDSGCLSRAATTALMQSIDASLDRRDLSQQWRVIESTLRVPTWLIYFYQSPRLRRLPIVNRLIDRSVFLHFCVSVEIASAFCRAEIKLGEFLQEYPVLASVNPEVMDDIQREAAVYAGRARLVFDDIRAAFPEVYSTVHSRHAALALLSSEERTLTHLHTSGLLSSVEFERLHETVTHQYVELKRSRLQNSMQPTEDVFLSQPYTRHLHTSQQDWLLSQAERLLLPPGQWIVGEGAHRPPGVYVVLRGQVAAYYHRTTADAGKVEGGGTGAATVNTAAMPDGARGHSTLERMGVGSLLSCRTLVDGNTDLYKSITACELLYFGLPVIRPALTEVRFEDCVMRAAACEVLKSTFIHLSPYGEMSGAALSALIGAASFASSDTNSSTGVHSTTALDSQDRLLLLHGRVDLASTQASQGGRVTPVDAPALVVVTGGATVRPSQDARWLMWSAAEEGRVRKEEMEAGKVQDSNGHPSQPSSSAVPKAKTEDRLTAADPKGEEFERSASRSSEPGDAED